MPKLLHDIKFNLATSCMELAFMHVFIDIDNFSIRTCERDKEMDKEIDEESFVSFVNKTKHMCLYRTSGKETVMHIYIHDNYVNIDIPYEFTFSLEKRVFIEFVQELYTIRIFLRRHGIIIDIKNNCVGGNTDDVNGEQTVICLFREVEYLSAYTTKLDKYKQKEIIDKILSLTKNVIFEPK